MTPPPRLGIAGRADPRLHRLAADAAVPAGGLRLRPGRAVTLPREEEPQISVPMVDILVRRRRAAGPRTRSSSSPSRWRPSSRASTASSTSIPRPRTTAVMVTARFLVGTSSDAAILRVHEKVRANMDRIPVGIPEPLIVGRGIDDVAIVALTLSPKPEAADRITANDLTRIARELRTEVAKIEDVGLTYLVGETGEMRSASRPTRSGWRSTASRCSSSPARSPAPTAPSRPAGSATAASRSTLVAGETLRSARRDRQPAADHPRRPAGLCRATSPRSASSPSSGDALVSHRRDGRRRGRSGVPAGDARHRQARRRQRRRPSPRRSCTGSRRSKGTLIPDDVAVDGHPQLRRDRQREGQRAALPPRPRHRLDHRAGLARHRLARGARGRHRHPGHDPADALRLLAHGLHAEPRLAVRADLLDRHPGRRRHRGDREHRPPLGHGRRPRPRAQAAIEAVAEVGNPTIVATLTVVAALLPMLFVSGLMGPYMSPIPANASAAMIFSFFVAVIVTPWLMLKIAGRAPRRAPRRPPRHDGGALGRAYAAVARPILRQRRRASWLFLAVVGVADARLAVAVLHQGRDGQAAALRQQVRARGGHRPARGRLGRGDRPRGAGRGARSCWRCPR